MTRSEAAKRVRACGGIMQGAVTQDTDFVILGDKRRGVSTKQLKAEKLITLGQDIQIIIEDDFIWLISMQKEGLPPI
jgi:DNA polymerase-3 subunit epsilon